MDRTEDGTDETRQRCLRDEVLFHVVERREHSSKRLFRVPRGSLEICGHRAVTSASACSADEQFGRQLDFLCLGAVYKRIYHERGVHTQFFCINVYRCKGDRCVAAVFIGITADYGNIFRYRIAVSDHGLSKAQSHAVIRACHCLGELSAALDQAVRKALTARVPEIAVEHSALVEFNTMFLQGILVCLQSDDRMRMPGFAREESDVLKTVLLYEVIDDLLLGIVVVDMDRREILAFLVDEEDFSFVLVMKVFFYAVSQTFSLDSVSHDDYTVESVVCYQLEDGRIADGTALGVLILDVHREDGDIVVTFESLLKETFEEESMWIFLRLSDQDSYSFAYPVSHIIILFSNIRNRN